MRRKVRVLKAKYKVKAKTWEGRESLSQPWPSAGLPNPGDLKLLYRWAAGQSRK